MLQAAIVAAKSQIDRSQAVKWQKEKTEHKQEGKSSTQDR